MGDRDDDLRARRREAGEVAWVGVDVLHDLRLAARGRRAADALADRDAHMLGRLRPLPRAEHEVVALDQVDPDPRVVLAPVVQQIDGRLQVAGRLDLVQQLAHDSRSSPSKSPIATRYQSGIGHALRSSRSTSTSVWFAVTIRTSFSTL